MPEILYFQTVRELLPYSPPFLLVDKVEDWSPYEYIHARKVVSGSDPLVYSHFNHGPVIIPGAILIELVGQAGLLLSILSSKNNGNENIAFLAKCKADFYDVIHVGDVIDVEVKMEAEILNKIVMIGEIKVNNKLMAKVTCFAVKNK